MTTPLPPPGAASPDDRTVISRRFIQHAREELRRGNRLQSSEKAWGAMAQALKAIAQARGWQHRGHNYILDAGHQIGMEYGHSRVLLATNHANNMHRNFYENSDYPEYISATITLIEDLLPELDNFRFEAPNSFTINDEIDRLRLRRLTGNQTLQIGDTSPVGFSLRHKPDPANEGDRRPIP
jgi:uncharacterized protein (UPF0332 family)